MPEVVRERRRLNDIGVEPAGRGDVVRVLLSKQLLGQAAPDLRHLQGVREPIVEDMALGRRYHLCDPVEPAKGGGILDAIAVTLSGRPSVLRIENRRTWRRMEACIAVFREAGGADRHAGMPGRFTRPTQTCSFARARACGLASDRCAVGR